MVTVASDRKNNGPYRLALTLLFIAPCAIALFASLALTHRAKFSASGLWFIYEVSFFVGCVGIVIASLAAVVEAFRRQIPAVFPWLMGVSAVTGILLLWYARRIYDNPWIPKT